VRGVLQIGLNRAYDKDVMLTGMALSRDPGDSRVFRRDQPVPPMPAVTTSVLDRVRDSRVLRVGYFEDSLPYAFFNRRGELVGFDVEMAFQPGRDLGVGPSWCRSTGR
jgi:ABC-type amino acid transport substrate-binding protein